MISMIVSVNNRFNRIGIYFFELLVDKLCFESAIGSINNDVSIFTFNPLSYTHLTLPKNRIV